MSQSNAGIRTFTAGGSALTRGLRVKISSGTVVVAGAGEEAIGTVTKGAAASSPVPVALDGWTREMIAAGTISAGADVYNAASGTVSDTVSGKLVGKCLEAGSASALFEVMVIQS